MYLYNIHKLILKNFMFGFISFYGPTGRGSRVWTCMGSWELPSRQHVQLFRPVCFSNQICLVPIKWIPLYSPLWRPGVAETTMPRVS